MTKDVSSKVKKIKLFSKDDMEQLGKIKIQLGISKSFIGYFKDRVYDVLKFFKIRKIAFCAHFKGGFYGFKMIENFSPF